MTVESLCTNRAATLIRARAFLLQEREKMNHSFDKDIAVAYGLPEAIILNHMQFVLKNYSSLLIFETKTVMSSLMLPSHLLMAAFIISFAKSCGEFPQNVSIIFFHKNRILYLQ